MSNTNQLQYFASQSYRQIQLSIDKGHMPYTYSHFSGQFVKLLDVLGDEAYTRQLTTQLIEETAQQGQTFDDLRQKMEVAIQTTQSVKQAKYVEADAEAVLV